MTMSGVVLELFSKMMVYSEAYSSLLTVCFMIYIQVIVALCLRAYRQIIVVEQQNVGLMIFLDDQHYSMETKENKLMASIYVSSMTLAHSLQRIQKKV